MTASPLFVSVADAAAMLGVSESTVWRMLADQQLVATRIRGARRIRVADLQAFRGTPENVVSLPERRRRARRGPVADVIPAGIKMPLEEFAR